MVLVLTLIYFGVDILECAWVSFLLFTPSMFPSRLGEDEGRYEKQGENNEPLRRQRRAQHDESPGRRLCASANDVGCWQVLELD